MRRYSEAVKADVRWRMSPPHRQSVARISDELGIHVITLYKWRKTWRLKGADPPRRQRQCHARRHAGITPGGDGRAQILLQAEGLQRQTLLGIPVPNA